MADKAKDEVKATDAPQSTDVGYAPTAPGQTEVVAGSVEHQQLLKSYPNATSYGGDVNVVVAPEPEPPPPEDGMQNQGTLGVTSKPHAAPDKDKGKL